MAMMTIITTTSKQEKRKWPAAIMMWVRIIRRRVSFQDLASDGFGQPRASNRQLKTEIGTTRMAKKAKQTFQKREKEKARAMKQQEKEIRRIESKKLKASITTAIGG